MDLIGVRGDHEECDAVVIASGLYGEPVNVCNQLERILRGPSLVLADFGHPRSLGNEAPGDGNGLSLVEVSSINELIFLTHEGNLLTLGESGCQSQ